MESNQMKNYRLEDFPVIKCMEDEKILCVQRQHPIVLIGQMLAQVILLFLIPMSILLIFYSFSYIIPHTLDNPIIISYIALTSLSAFFTIELYTFMAWYYHFYIITNKAIVHEYAFRIIGPFSESVFGEKMHIQDIDRRPQNLLYDFLKIQDVYIYFHKLEREDPFIFRTPSDSQLIEDILRNLITESRHKEGVI